jgi:hypothetical protein
MTTVKRRGHRDIEVIRRGMLEQFDDKKLDPSNRLFWHSLLVID